MVDGREEISYHLPPTIYHLAGEIDMSDDSTRVMPVPEGVMGDRTMVAPAAFGATQQMPAAGLGDVTRTQMGGVTTCPVCQTTTPVMETYCGECGYLLSSAPVPDLEVPTEEAPAAELVDLTDGRRYLLRKGVNTLGRQGTDVLVNEGTVSRVHAQITIDGDVIKVEDLGSSNGTKVGNVRLTANQPMRATLGTELKFGNWRVLLQRDSADAAPATILGGATIALPAASAVDRAIVGEPSSAEAIAETPVAPPLAPVATSLPAVAILQKTQGPGEDISLPEGRVTVGRRPDNTVVLTNDAYISGRHAEIVTQGTETYLTDLGSTNGSMVNGQKLTPQERQLLLEGDEVQVGQTRYVFKPVKQEPPSAGVETEEIAAFEPDGEPT
jgi:pSer/pThr/pTyr-binding forkhead associated (FHA) protein